MKRYLLIPRLVVPLVLLAAISCGSSEHDFTETQRGSLTAECEPRENYDECLMTDDVDLDSATDVEARWRTVSERPEGGWSVEVDASRFNAGYIPQEVEDGAYSSEDAFVERLSLILGLRDVQDFSYGDFTQSGKTIKWVGDYTTFEFGAGSSGDFLCDAMTDASGEFVTLIFTRQKERVTDHLSQKEWWFPGWVGLCYDEGQVGACADLVGGAGVDTVCSFGIAGGARGFTGTKSACNDYWLGEI